MSYEIDRRVIYPVENAKKEEFSGGKGSLFAQDQGSHRGLFSVDGAKGPSCGP